MKKTLIALATVASLATVSGNVFAQVAITGGVDFTYYKNAAAPADGSAAKGLAATDAYIDITVSEDLGGGMKAVAAMEFNADGGWAAGNYAGDKSVTISTPSLSVTAASTRSGGILNAIMLAPEVNGNDHWGTGAKVTAAVDYKAGTEYALSTKAAAASFTAAVGGGGVMTRAGVDALVISLPVADGLKVAYKYVESGDGYGSPAAVVNVLGAYYAKGPLTLQGEYNNATASAATLAAYAAAAGTTDVRLTRLDLTAAYDAGFAKFAAGYESGSFGTANSSNIVSGAGAFLLSAKAPVGNAVFGVNYGKRDVSSFQEYAVQYNLSQLTYVAVSAGTYTNASAADGSTTYTTDSFGVRLGHNF